MPYDICNQMRQTIAEHIPKIAAQLKRTGREITPQRVGRVLLDYQYMEREGFSDEISSAFGDIIVHDINDRWQNISPTRFEKLIAPALEMYTKARPPYPCRREAFHGDFGGDGGPAPRGWGR